MKIMRMLAAGAALAALVASPAFAQGQGVGDSSPQTGTRVHPEGVHHPRVHAAVPRARRHAAIPRARRSQSPYAAYAQATGEGASTGRDEALRQCTEQSRKYSESTWGDMQMQLHDGARPAGVMR